MRFSMATSCTPCLLILVILLGFPTSPPPFLMALIFLVSHPHLLLSNSVLVYSVYSLFCIRIQSQNVVMVVVVWGYSWELRFPSQTPSSPVVTVHGLDCSFYRLPKPNFPLSLWYQWMCSSVPCHSCFLDWLSNMERFGCEHGMHM